MTPRLSPLPEDEWDDEVRAVIDENRALLRRPKMPDSITTLLHHPRIAGAWFHYNTVLLRAPALPDRLRELCILRAMWLARAQYMWLDHVEYARKLGVADEEIVAVTVGAGEPRWKPVEAAVLAATDDLVERFCIGDETWQRLAEHLDKAQLLELPFVVGSYLTLGMVYASAGTVPDDFLTAIPAPVVPPQTP